LVVVLVVVLFVVSFVVLVIVLFWSRSLLSLPFFHRRRGFFFLRRRGRFFRLWCGRFFHGGVGDSSGRLLLVCDVW